MKTYIRLLDVLIVVFLTFSVYFNVSDHCMLHSYTSRNGLSRTMVISWQSLFLYSSFCVLLRYLVTKTLDSSSE